MKLKFKIYFEPIEGPAVTVGTVGSLRDVFQIVEAFQSRYADWGRGGYPDEMKTEAPEFKYEGQDIRVRELRSGLDFIWEAK